MSTVFLTVWLILATLYAMSWFAGERVPAWVPMLFCLLLAHKHAVEVASGG